MTSMDGPVGSPPERSAATVGGDVPAVPGALIGTVVRLQVQRSPLKPGPRGARVYDPAPLLQVDELMVGPRGVSALVDGVELLDVHHADHPDSRNRGLMNGLSVLPRLHHERIRAAFGGHVVAGAAGESLLLDTDRPLVEADLAGDLVLETVDGPPLTLSGAVAAAPCVEFSRWCLGRGLGPVDDDVLTALGELDSGTRGFYLRTEGVGRIRSGARLLRA